MKKWKVINKAKIINNLNSVFKYKRIENLSKYTYDFLYLLNGFIAHYNINGFKEHYKDLRELISDLKESDDVENSLRYINDNFFQKDDISRDYYKSKAETLKEIMPLIKKYEQEINEYFRKEEENSDLNKIKSLMVKNNMKEIII